MGIGGGVIGGSEVGGERMGGNDINVLCHTRGVIIINIVIRHSA